MMTWRQLTRLQPELKDLEQAALEAHNPHGPVNWTGLDRLKRKLSKLVGWWCKTPADPRLQTQEAWKVAYTHLLYCFEKGHGPGAKQPTPDGGLPDAATLELMGQPELTL